MPVAMLLSLGLALSFSLAQEPYLNPIIATSRSNRELQVLPFDWPQWGGSGHRNHVAYGPDVPRDWDVTAGRNVLWSVDLGSQTYSTPVIANGRVFVGTNNGFGYLARYPSEVDLGCLLCFDATTGEFLWQHSNLKLAAGRVHDWPTLGVCSTPCVAGDRLWYVSNRGEVVCLDTQGFRDGENDGPVIDERPADAKVIWDEQHEADVVWKLDMLQELAVFPHNMSICSVTVAGDTLFVKTSNGMDESHVRIPNPEAPSFLALNRHTGEILWTDNSPGANVLHGQWGSPAYGIFDGQPQVLFGGGDGWLYSFDPAGAGDGTSRLLWKFDCNPKESRYSLRGNRNHLIASPCVYEGLVYVAVGEDPEHGDGDGHLWCIDPRKRGDVSPELVFNERDPLTPIAPKRLQACEPDQGDFVRPNPNSALVWHYSGVDLNGNKKLDFEETMHRTLSTVAIQDDLLIVPDFSGLVHCLDARTGQPHWVHDLLSACWTSPLIVNDHVYVGDEDGDLSIIKLSPDFTLVTEIPHNNSFYSTPVVANRRLYLTARDTLFAIETNAQSAPLRQGNPRKPRN